MPKRNKSYDPKAKNSKSKKSKLGILFYAVVAATCFGLMFYFTSLKPRLPSTALRSTLSKVQVPQGPPILLSNPNTTKVTTDVRGNLGPPEVMLRDGTDWIKDRWQAASDMHGTAIKGPHYVLLSFHAPLQLHSIILDWEAAYSKDYVVEGAHRDLIWTTLYDTQDTTTATSQQPHALKFIKEEQLGQSPGVKSKTPLHILHTLGRPSSTELPPTLQYLRLTIRSSAMGWGVSLWRIQVMGWPA